jgi:hypothetical protein
MRERGHDGPTIHLSDTSSDQMSDEMSDEVSDHIPKTRIP